MTQERLSSCLILATYKEKVEVANHPRKFTESLTKGT